MPSQFPRAFRIQNGFRIVVSDLQEQTRFPLDGGFIAKQAADLHIQLVPCFSPHKAELLCPGTPVQTLMMSLPVKDRIFARWLFYMTIAVNFSLV